MSGFSVSFSFDGFSIIKIILLLLLCLVGFAVVHGLKLMRLYLVVMEQHISFKRFVPAYLRTTLANLIIPYKIGEIYRIGVFSRITGSINIGFFSVLVDRFFDTLALIVILLPYQIMCGRGISISVALLTVFLLVVIFAYVMFPSSYKYLNRYIITSRTSKHSMAALRGLETVNGWYGYVKGLVSGRYGLMMLFSLGAWIFELLVLGGISKMFGIGFSVSEFGDYISSILSGSSTRLNMIYTVYSVIIIAIACIIFTTVYLSDLKKENDV